MNRWSFNIFFLTSQETSRGLELLRFLWFLWFLLNFLFLDRGWNFNFFLYYWSFNFLFLLFLDNWLWFCSWFRFWLERFLFRLWISFKTIWNRHFLHFPWLVLTYWTRRSNYLLFRFLGFILHLLLLIKSWSRFRTNNSLRLTFFFLYLNFRLLFHFFLLRR